jgi:hypothetical protein
MPAGDDLDAKEATCSLDALVATEIRTAHARQPSATCAASVNLRAY